MNERFAVPYNDFVIPFMIGMTFVLVFTVGGLVRIIAQLPARDRKKMLKVLINPKKLFKTIKDIILDCLIHVKIFKRKFLLGYMHSSIAFGWFMLIVIGHIEVWLYTPQRMGLLYYPIFFRYFVAETESTLRGAFFFFLMDFFLLMVLSGIFLAMFKRIRSQVLGMRRTTKTTLTDKIAMYSLWSIFPLRLFAESFTAGISGGSFLTKPMYWLFSNFLTNDYHILPTWWAYSIALGVFMIFLPFSRYMHIPTEMLLIWMRNAGIKTTHPKNGYTSAELYSCSSCGLCIDACPMGTQRKNLKYTTVYYNRFLRRGNKRKTALIADKCLMCGKCVAVCPVGIESTDMKRTFRSIYNSKIDQDFSYFNKCVLETNNNVTKNKILYYAGCVTHLTPSISASISKILNNAGVEWEYMDKDGGICCGRPLMLAGNEELSKEMIRKNTDLIRSSGATTLLLSCPICYKIFKEKYDLKGIDIVHHSVYLNNLLKSGMIKVRHGFGNIVYHDPCELGRGANIYNEPRELLSNFGNLVSAQSELKESICCGGSLGSITLSSEDRSHITDMSLRTLTINNPDIIATSCPLCMKTFSQKSEIPVTDISQIVANNLI